MRRLFHAVPALWMLMISPALAEDWVVSRLSGQAWSVSTQGNRTSVSAGTTLAEGAALITGKNSRVGLVRGAETILVSPNSQILIPQQSNSPGITTIQQQSGRIEFDVEKRNVKHFAVETPYLAAVVKGTHFTVNVTATNAEVAVERGTVEVQNSTGQHVDVTAGQRATVGGSGASGIQVSKAPSAESGRSGERGASGKDGQSQTKAEADGQARDKGAANAGGNAGLAHAFTAGVPSAAAGQSVGVGQSASHSIGLNLGPSGRNSVGLGVGSAGANGAGVAAGGPNGLGVGRGGVNGQGGGAGGPNGLGLGRGGPNGLGVRPK